MQRAIARHADTSVGSHGSRLEAPVSVDDQFTVFGAASAILFTLFSGLLLARFAPTRGQQA